MILGQLCLETMRLETLTKVIQPLTISGTANPDIKGVVYDSRQVRPGSMFVAVHGLHSDGADYIDEAVARGAVAVVSERGDWVYPGVAHVRVDDARRALAEISCAFYGEPSGHLQVIGVTGTNGKTTTAYMIRDILRADGRCPGMIGTISYEMGARSIPAGRTTPEAPELQAMLDQMLRGGCRSAVMEVSSHALDQQRVWGIDFDVGVFTNLTSEHLDYHGNIEGYFAAKARLFGQLGQMEKKAAAIINLDDPWGMKLAGISATRVQPLTFGLHPAADIRAEKPHLSAQGAQFILRTPWGDAQAHIPLLGQFNISNALAAFAACGALGIDPGLMAETLADLHCVPGRLESVSNKQGIRLFIDYAHTADALANALKTVRPVARGKVIVVFGCGGDRDKTKRPAMGQVAGRLADHTIITTDNPRCEDPGDITESIVEGISGEGPYEVILDRREAIARGIRLAQRGDVLLIAGKGHESGQEIAHTVVPFDDRQVALELLD